MPPKESYAPRVAEPVSCPRVSTHMGDIYSLDTPERVAVGYDVAGVGSRFLAALIDALVLAVVLAALAIVTFLAGLSLRGTIAAFRSTDGGATWSREVPISRISFHPNSGGLR